MLPQIATRPSPADADTRARLAADLRTGWEEEQAGWDAQVTGDAMSGTDLWGSMPTVDSKTVARMAPTFEKHEGRPFDVGRIRPGGYLSIDAAIQDLVFGK